MASHGRMRLNAVAADSGQLSINTVIASGPYRA
jgi:phage terminase large subunit GpA-like protein